MITTYLTRIAALGATAALAAALGIGTAAPALADDVIAIDTTTAAPVAAAAVPTALASRPRTIVVTHHGGRSVTLFAKGERIRRVLAPGSRPATFTGLTAGRIYTVAIGGQPIGSVVALDRPTAASGLTVRTTGTPGTVALSWRHRATTATGGRAVRFDVRATSTGAPTVTATVTGTPKAVLTGLDVDAIYTFRVTPRNNAGAGRATTATMGRSLAQAGGRPASTPVAQTPVAQTPTTVPVTQVPAAPADARTGTGTRSGARARRPGRRPGPSGCAPTASPRWAACARRPLPTPTTRCRTRTTSEFVQTGTHVEYSGSPNGGTYYPAGQPQWDFGPAGYYKVVTDGYEQIVKDPMPDRLHRHRHRLHEAEPGAGGLPGRRHAVGPDGREGGQGGARLIAAR